MYSSGASNPGVNDPAAGWQLADARLNFERLIAGQTQADRLYDRIPETFNGKVLGTDHARLLCPFYAAGVMGRLRFNDATAKPTRQYTKERL